MADAATVQARLTAAQNALHDLIMGKSAVTIAYDGESVTYKSADESRLRNYIAELETQLGLRSRPRAPSRAVIFRT